jgi:hypothetical protein
MALAQKLQRLDGRHKLAIVMAMGAWVVSIYFSQVGFGVDNHKAAWLGWFLGLLVTTVELVFNSKTHKLSMTLIGVGILCYLYGVWTNVEGFWTFQNPDSQFVIFSQSSIMSWFVGLVMEILPEPMFMWGIGAELDGDLVGNIVGLWSGDLPYAHPSNESPSVPARSRAFSSDTDATPIPFKSPYPNTPKKNKKLASHLFNDKYTDRFKKN